MTEFRYFNYQLFVRTEDAANRTLAERTRRGKLKNGWVEKVGTDDQFASLRSDKRLEWVVRGTEVRRG